MDRNLFRRLILLFSEAAGRLGGLAIPCNLKLAICRKRITVGTELIHTAGGGWSVKAVLTGQV